MFCKKKNHSQDPKIIIIILLIISFSLLLFFKTKSNKIIAQSQFLIAMDTSFKIKIEPNNSKTNELETVFSKVFEEIVAVEKAALAKGNNETFWNGKNQIILGKYQKQLIIESLKWESLSQGSFSPTISKITNLWDIPNKGKYVPPEDSILKCLEKIGDPKKRFVRGNTLLKQDFVSFDFGAIAKGFALTKVSEILQHYVDDGTIKEYLIDAGRSISGYRKDSCFVIGISHPRNNSIFASFNLPSGWFCSSCGDYERFFILNDIRYHHIFDPKTGYPAHKSIATTIIGPDGSSVDALSTAVFVLGPEKGLELLKNLDSFFGLVIYIDADSIAFKVSDDFEDKFDLQLIR